MSTDDSDEGSGFRRQLVEEAITREIIGAFYDVYNTLRFGFFESIYSRSMEIALRDRGLTVEREFPIDVYFRGICVGRHRIDLLVARRVVLEVKSTHAIADANKRQLLSYLTAMDLEVGLLLHFGPRARFYRVLGRWRRNGERNDQGDRSDP